MNIKPLKTETDYEEALSRINELMDATPDSKEGDELDVLSVLVENYEAIHHAANRRLYNMYVTDFQHVKQNFVDAYTRLVAMKLFGLRTADYMRVASDKDRRYLLYAPVMKMKTTTQGEEVINLLWDVIAAKGFEKDTWFEIAARDIRALPKLEGTVHVNVALIVKFIANYFFKLSR